MQVKAANDRLPAGAESPSSAVNGRSSGSERLIVAGLLLAYAVLTFEMTRVRPPADEGNHGSVAAIFASHHYLSMPMLNGVWLPGLDKHLYALMPLYFLCLAAWFKAFGVGLMTMRSFSIVWGII